MCRRLGLSIEPQKWGDLWHFDIPSLSFISNENSRDRHRPSRGARASRSAQVANWVNPRLILAARQRFGQTILSILLSCQKKSTDRITGFKKSGQEAGLAGFRRRCPDPVED